MGKQEFVFYSKKDGVNQLLFLGNDLASSEQFFDERFKEHKPFAYTLVDGVEIKLFTSREDE